VGLAVALDTLAKTMLAEFEGATKEIGHSERKGQAREAIVARYLREYLPPTVDVLHGAEILAADGTISPECDVAITDPNSPTYKAPSGYRVVPNESVYGVIEVKSKLDSRELEGSVEKIRGIKRTEKTAVQAQTGAIVRSTSLYGREWKEYFPTNGIIFAFDSIDLVKLATELAMLDRGVEYAHRVDGIYVLTKGFVAPHDPASDEIAPAPWPGSDLKVVDSDNPLLALTLQLQTIYHGAWSPGLRLAEYLKHAKLGTGRTLIQTLEPQANVPG
jgi:hypothetical protein